MMESNKFELPELCLGNKISIKQSEKMSNIVALTFSAERNVWFNYNCVCKDTGRRIIIAVPASAVDIAAENGMICFFSVAWTEEDLLPWDKDVFACRPKDCKILYKNKIYLPTRNVIKSDIIREYVNSGCNRILFEEIWSSNLLGEIEQNFHVAYPVDENNVPIKGMPVTYHFEFNDDGLYRQDFITQELFLLGQKEMLNTTGHREIFDFSKGFDNPVRSCWIQFKQYGLYQNYLELEDKDKTVVLEFSWLRRDNMFTVEDVYLGDSEKGLVICYIPEKDSPDLWKSNIVKSVTMGAINKRTKTLKCLDKYVLLKSEDFI